MSTGSRGSNRRTSRTSCMLKLTFYPGTDMAAAMSQVVSLANRARGQMPPSVLPPFVMRFDAANVPIGYLVLESKTRPLGRIGRPGAVPHPPDADRPDCRARSPFRPLAATRGRSSSRSIPTACGPTTSRPRTWCRRWGPATWSRRRAICIRQAQMPLVPTNAMVADPQEMGNIPIQLGKRRLHPRRGHDRTTPRTSTTAARWSTAASRSISRWSRRTRLRR